MKLNRGDDAVSLWEFVLAFLSGTALVGRKIPGYTSTFPHQNTNNNDTLDADTLRPARTSPIIILNHPTSNVVVTGSDRRPHWLRFSTNSDGSHPSAAAPPPPSPP